LVIALPTLCGLIGLVVDGGLLLSAARQLQHVADSASTAAAIEKKNGQTNSEAQRVAEHFVHDHNRLTNATVTLNCPPSSGPYAGSSGYVEIIIDDQTPTYFIHVLGGANVRNVSARSVAGYESSTAGAAIVVLDPDPPAFNLSTISISPLLPSFPAIVGGLEALGAGNITVDGAVLVNTEWGGKDENGQDVGETKGVLGTSHAISATPVSRLLARDIRVVGGVDDPNHYGPLDASDPSPLKAGRLPVPDPLGNLPVPTMAVDSQNVKDTMYGGVSVNAVPLIGTPVTLQPGVYDWIEVNSGIADFMPGIYVVRGVNPITQLAINVVGGQVRANGVMFYITDSAGYTPASGAPDNSDGESTAPFPSLASSLPSALINVGLLGSSFSGLNAPGSPFHGMLIYQRRHDRRPIILVQENLIGAGQLRGTIYSKWGHLVLAGKGTYEARIVVGTLRLLALLDMNVQPGELLPPAEDVYLVE
jgi:hypothetical protein